MMVCLTSHDCKCCKSLHTFAQVDGDMWRTAKLVDSVELPYIAPSLGGCETLIEQPTIVSYWDQVRHLCACVAREPFAMHAWRTYAPDGVVPSNQAVQQMGVVGPPSTTACAALHLIALCWMCQGPEMRAKLGIKDNLLRFSTGIEDMEDIWADLAQALDRI